MTNESAANEIPFSDQQTVRVRFPPSPTGHLHVGGARTALFNWLFAHGESARQGLQGELIVRIEDTDRSRYVPGAAEGMLDMLEWFGMTWDEGPDKGGPVGPYIQSERTEIYQHHANLLLEAGSAYRCFCSSERLAALRDQQRANHQAPGYDRHCRTLSAEEIAARLEAGDSSVVRFAMPREGETIVNDLLRGEMVFQNEKLEDLILLKTDGYPTYHLANVVDDHHMGITHILRGEEWIPTAPVHVQLYRAFGWEVPTFAHMPLILAPTGGKLSKRHGSTAMEEFRDQGYLPEALMNYLALLGWSLDDSTEMFSREDLLEKWTLARVSPSPATFDYDKLRWFNHQYINHVIELDDLTGRIVPFLIDAGLATEAARDTASDEYGQIRRSVEVLKDRIPTLGEAPDLMRFFLTEDVEPYDSALLVPKKAEPAAVRAGLVETRAALVEIGVEDEDAVETRLRAVAEAHGLKAGQLFMPIRIAVTGRKESPGLFETLRVVGDERVQARLAGAIDRLDTLESVPVDS